MGLFCKTYMYKEPIATYESEDNIWEWSMNYYSNWANTFAVNEDKKWLSFIVHPLKWIEIMTIYKMNNE